MVIEHLEPGPYSGGHLPPDRERRRMLDADELAKARTILDESHVLARGDVNAGRPPGGCGGIEYRLDLTVAVDGKRIKRRVRGPIAAECWMPKLKFPMSAAAIGARRLVDGLKALVDGS